MVTKSCHPARNELCIWVNRIVKRKDRDLFRKGLTVAPTPCQPTWQEKCRMGRELNPLDAVTSACDYKSRPFTYLAPIREFLLEDKKAGDVCKRHRLLIFLLKMKPIMRKVILFDKFIFSSSAILRLFGLFPCAFWVKVLQLLPYRLSDRPVSLARPLLDSCLSLRSFFRSLLPLSDLCLLPCLNSA